MKAQNGERILVGIPTRDRPEYLASLLATLLFQTEEKWDLLIIDSSTSGASLEDHPMMVRYLGTIKALGHKVTVKRLQVCGRSEAVAVNRIMVEAKLQKYPFLYKVDDDHILPPNTLAKLKEDLLSVEQTFPENPVLVSAITPWMVEAWPGAYGPSSLGRVKDIVDRPMIDIWSEYFDTLEAEVQHFVRYPESKGMIPNTLFNSKFASAANFFMRPRVEFLWSDIGPSSLSADAVWFAQLRHFLGAKFCFDTTVEAWHVAAPSGGVQPSGDSVETRFDKGTDEDKMKTLFLAAFLTSIGREGKGW